MKSPVIENILRKIRAGSKRRATGFVIGNTSGVFKQGRLYPIPIRETGTLIYGGVIVRDVATAGAVARMIDGKTDYVFVDAEKKIETMYHGKNDVGNIERMVRGVILKSKIITYKGNDLTKDAIDFLLGQLIVDIGGTTVAVIGCGNLGAKIALKLVERGAHVRAYRRDKGKLRKIVTGLNQIKSEHTLSSIWAARSIADACKGASAVIATADSQGIIKHDHLKFMNIARPPILIDAGKGCFSDDVVRSDAYAIYRADVSIAQKHIFSALLETKLHYGRSIGRRVLEDGNVGLVSLGLLGKKGEVIVDDIDSPRRIIGVADGRGKLMKNVGSQKKVVEKIRRMFNAS
ncbi:MAG: hypothetical protein G01um10148_304 [Parcubacteria group bacterium Gr01-1014_8]|nr:MAG: hypothetical protein G01um10148_304 [Parcubacteria group bacterium Gr01-1014_8]